MPNPEFLNQPPCSIRESSLLHSVPGPKPLNQNNATASRFLRVVFSNSEKQGVTGSSSRGLWVGPAPPGPGCPPLFPLRAARFGGQGPEQRNNSGITAEIRRYGG